MGKPLNCTTSLSPGQVDPVTGSTAVVLPTQEAQLAFADTWQTGMWGESGAATLHFQAVSAVGSKLPLQGNDQPHASCLSW